MKDIHGCVVVSIGNFYLIFWAIYIAVVSIRLCKWLKQLDSKLSPVKGFMGSNPLSIIFVFSELQH